MIAVSSRVRRDPRWEDAPSIRNVLEDFKYQPPKPNGNTEVKQPATAKKDAADLWGLVMDLAHNDCTPLRKFLIFHAKHPHIYSHIEDESLRVSATGLDQYNIVLTVAQVKVDWKVKIPSDFKAYYARLFMARNPGHQKFYRVRKVPGEDKWWKHAKD